MPILRTLILLIGFFLKDKPVLKNIDLTNALINLKRTDSVWNYQFIVNYFTSPNKDTLQRGGLEIDIKKLHLQKCSHK